MKEAECPSRRLRRRPPRRRRQVLLDACAQAAKRLDVDARARLMSDYSPPLPQQWQCLRLQELVGRLPPKRKLCRSLAPRTPVSRPAPAGDKKRSGQSGGGCSQDVQVAQPAPPKKRKKKSRNKGKKSIDQLQQQQPPSGLGHQVPKAEKPAAKNEEQTTNKGASEASITIQFVVVPKKQKQGKKRNKEATTASAPAVPKKQNKRNRKGRSEVQSGPLRLGFLNLNRPFEAEPLHNFKVLS